MKDRIREDDINIIYCPIEIMVADYFTKPSQGDLFKKIKKNYNGIDTLKLTF